MTANVAILFCLLCLGLGSANADSIAIGGRSLKIPAPAGFDRCPDTVANTTGDGNRVLALFAPPDVVARIQAGESPTIPRSFNVQASESNDTRDVSLAAFAMLRGKLIDQLQPADPTEWDNALQRMFAAEPAGIDTVFRPKVFENSSVGLGFTLVDEQSRMLVASLTTVANGRLLLLYGGAPAESADSARSLEQAMRDWAQAIRGANPVFKPSFPVQNRLILFAAVGILAVAIALRSSKRRRTG